MTVAESFRTRKRLFLNGHRGGNMPTPVCRWLIPWVLLAFAAGCQTAAIIGSAVEDRPLRDGVYTGSYSNWPNGAKVRVTVKDGRIESVEVVRHFSSWKGWPVNTIIPQRIVETQSTRVDVVSGATNSSVVVMNAAEKALEKAQP
jgi:uncharacterized protein with FMN-binding domain